MSGNKAEAAVTITYEPERNRFNMPTDAGDAYVTIRWDGDVMILPHAEVPSALRGAGAGARLATGVFEQIEAMGIKARPTCSFLVKVAKSEPRWQNLFGL
ncbi:GNAT family N-acetyltransferase [Sphingorhabdus sp.]|uniref:GNAT family N-acetyltransferase n=1 Tax=Sphingorhabdus sp. TaxID=1902408 RepID=UPI0037CC44A8